MQVIFKLKGKSEHTQKYIDIGIYTYLYKPIDVSILVDTVLDTLKEMQINKALVDIE